VVLTQAHRGEGIADLWQKIQDHRQVLTETSELERRRQRRRTQEFMETVEGELGRRWRQRLDQDPALMALREQIARKELEPYSAAMELLRSFPTEPG